MNATIKHFGNVAWAVITSHGVAIFPSSTEAVRAVRTNSVSETEQDQAWYDEHGPWHQCDDLTQEATS